MTTYLKPGATPGYNSLMVYVKNQHASIVSVLNSSADSVDDIRQAIFNQAVMKAVKDCSIIR